MLAKNMGKPLILSLRKHILIHSEGNLINEECRKSLALPYTLLLSSDFTGMKNLINVKSVGFF